MSSKFVYEDGTTKSLGDIIDSLIEELEEAADGDETEEESTTIVIATILKNGTILTLNDTRFTIKTDGSTNIII